MSLDAALALIPDDELRARSALEAVWNHSVHQGDRSTAFQAAAGMLLAFGFYCVDYRGRMRWCMRFRDGLSESPAANLPERAASGDPDAMRICAAGLVLPTLDDDTQVLPADWLASAAGALLRGLHQPTDLPPAQRLVLAKVLLDHQGLQMDTLEGSRVLALQQERLRLDPLSPAAQAHWWVLAMSHHDYFGETGAALHARDRLQTLIDAHGLHEFRAALLTQEMPIALRTGQLERAGRIHRDLDALMADLRAGFVIQALRAQSTYLTQRGQHGAALGLVDRLLALCTDLEVPERDQGAYRVLRSNVLVALGRFDEARCELHGLRASQTGGQGELLEVIIRFVEAAALLDTQPSAALDWLGSAMTDAARLSFNRFFMTLPALAARLCQLALDAGIEAEFVHATIRERRLVPPDTTRADWPWAVKVQVLGGLAIWRDGVQLVAAGKAQRKPLELLALLAAQGGRAVGADLVIDTLWPSLEADAPKSSLDMTISRLRRLLDCPEALVVNSGSVALDPSLVWCDSAAFEALSERLTMRLAAGHAPIDEQAHAARRLFGLYRGRLMGTDTLSGPMSLARERLALAHHRSVTAWGHALEKQGQWADAIALYEQALGIDALAEPVHRALMRVLLAQGERAEALRAYRRCHAMLSSALGTTPTRETQALGLAAGATELRL